MPRRPDGPAAAGDPAAAGLKPGGWGKIYPLLASWLCEPNFDDGTPVGMVRLTIDRFTNGLSAELKTEYGGQRLRVFERQPDILLATLEALLGASVVPWEPDRFPLARQAQTKSKKK